MGILMVFLAMRILKEQVQIFHFKMVLCFQLEVQNLEVMQLELLRLVKDQQHGVQIQIWKPH